MIFKVVMNYLFLAQRIYIKKKSLEKDLGLKHFCKFTSCKSFFGFATFVITEKSNEGFGRAFGPLECKGPIFIWEKFEDFTFLLILPQGIEKATSTVCEVEVRIEMHGLLPGYSIVIHYLL